MIESLSRFGYITKVYKGNSLGVNMAIQLLYGQDFQQIGRQTKTMAIKIPDPMLVLFKMVDCPNCKVVEPIFVQLSKEKDVPRIRYGIADVGQQKDIVAISRGTTTPLQAVPTLILYANGRPLAKFNGAKNLVSLKKFIATALSAASQDHPGGGGGGHPPSQQFMPAAPQGGMYGNDGYHSGPPPGYQPEFPQQGRHPQAPQQRQQPGGRGGGGQAKYMPEINGSALPNKSNVNYSFLDVEEEDDHRLSLPGDVIPYNAPWEDTSYKKL